MSRRDRHAADGPGRRGRRRRAYVAEEVVVTQYERQDIPPAPLHGVEELQGQLDAAWKFLAFRASQVDAADAEIGQLDAQLDLARAELASARQELDAVRTARDNLDRELAEARATIRALTRTQGAGT